jgi:hypothetical protein
MVINNLDIDRAGRATWPLKTDPPLVVDADAVLALAFAPQGFQPIAGQSEEILQARRRLQSLQSYLRLTCETGKFLDVLAITKTLGFAVPVVMIIVKNLRNYYALRQA